jgi:GMP synthase-like glutamine amidotransferase
MPRILVFRHVPFEGLGRFEAELHSQNIGFDYADLYASAAQPADPTEYDALIFMGGPMSVSDDLPYLRREEGHIRQAVERGVPILGVCLGGQLIAHAMGAAVRRNPVKEIGWFDIALTAAGQRDRLFSGFGERESVFHWHGETFDLPHGAELLASSERCRNQAFRLGSSVYALQFHLEVTPEMIAEWCLADENCGDMRELGSPIDVHAHKERMGSLAGAVVVEWCKLVVDRTSPPARA